MKRLTIVLLSILIVITCSVAYAENDILEMPEIKIAIEGKRQEFPDATIAVSGRTLLPIRWTVEALGVPNNDEHIIWNQAEQSVTVKDEGLEIYLKINQDKAKINGKEITLDVPLLAYNNRTYIPVRFISEALNKSVVWVEDIKTVFIRDEVQFNHIKQILDKNEEVAKNTLKYIRISETRRYTQPESGLFRQPVVRNEEIADKDSRKYCVVSKSSVPSLRNDSPESDTDVPMKIGLEIYAIDNRRYVKYNDASVTYVSTDEESNKFWSDISPQFWLYSYAQYGGMLCSILNYAEDLSDERQIILKGGLDDPEIIPAILHPYRNDIMWGSYDVCSYKATLNFDKDTYLLNECSSECKLQDEYWNKIDEYTDVHTTSKFSYNPDEINIEVPQEIIDNAVDVTESSS